jgi:hypothetical protein
MKKSKKLLEEVWEMIHLISWVSVDMDKLDEKIKEYGECRAKEELKRCKKYHECEEDIGK